LDIYLDEPIPPEYDVRMTNSIILDTISTEELVEELKLRGFEVNYLP
jgi:hypothetical protein